jgi:DNA-directed RNA polymerase specialized sigma24 family protein
MDRGTAIDRLPEAYANALRLCDQGHDNEAIAARLHLPPEAVRPLLRLAAAKLQAILAANEATHDLVPDSERLPHSRPQQGESRP